MPMILGELRLLQARGSGFMIRIHAWQPVTGDSLRQIRENPCKSVY
jgi:hypothetical protein